MAESERFWDQLLDYIEAGDVIPVVGRDLLEVEVDGKKQPLYPRLARNLATKLDIDEDRLSSTPTLNEVACRFLEEKGARRDDLYWAMSKCVPENLPLPTPLRQLAEIRPLMLFLSTTCDDLVRRALDDVRFEGNDETDVITYSPGRARDLPLGWSPRGVPTVFHLLGRLTNTPSYTLTDEDTLEFVHSHQSESRRPERLLDQISRGHLLVLGCSFDNWLARFFLRATQMQHRLLIAEGTDYLADATALRDHQLSQFLEHFSNRTQLFGDGGAVEFVDEMHQRWLSRHPDGGGPSLEDDMDEAELRTGYVFLSYAKEDLDMARAIRDALYEQGNIEVWFDKRELDWGDRWDRKIRRCIEGCAYFLPVVSRNSLRRTKKRRYFRREWDLAADEGRGSHKDEPFILPLIADDSPLEDGGVPEAFREVQAKALTLSGGKPTSELVDKVRSLVRDYEREMKGRRREPL